MAAVWSHEAPSTRCTHRRAHRPALVVLPGGVSSPSGRHRPATPVAASPAARPVADRAVYARRRLLVLATLAALLVLAGAILARLDGEPLTREAPAGVELPADDIARRVHVVQPGETLWDIAVALAPDADPRATVDLLVDLNGGGSLAVGERLVLP
jgi:hypothetical protein